MLYPSPTEGALTLISMLTAARLNEDEALQGICADLKMTPEQQAVFGCAAGVIWGLLEAAGEDPEEWLQNLAARACHPDFNRGWAT